MQVLHMHDHGELAWLKLPESIRTGVPMFEAAYGKPMFEYLHDNPKEEVKFSQAMTELDHTGGPRTALSVFSACF